jgi:hypothetical protein
LFESRFNLHYLKSELSEIARLLEGHIVPNKKSFECFLDRLLAMKDSVFPGQPVRPPSRFPRIAER